MPRGVSEITDFTDLTTNHIPDYTDLEGGVSVDYVVISDGFGVTISSTDTASATRGGSALRFWPRPGPSGARPLFHGVTWPGLTLSATLTYALRQWHDGRRHI